MSTKVLVANRGEIACRIIRTLRRMGVASVAVYSDADRAAPHVRMADEAVRIGPAPAGRATSTASASSTRRCAPAPTRSTPGYGFLSENADFAAAVEAAGLAFVGPTPEQIRALRREAHGPGAGRGRRRPAAARAPTPLADADGRCAARRARSATR